MVDEIVVDDLFRLRVKRFGIAKIAKMLHCRYALVRQAAIKAGIEIRRGRRPDKRKVARNIRIRALREKKKLYLHEIGEQVGVGRERVRQVLANTGGDPLSK